MYIYNYTELYVRIYSLHIIYVELYTYQKKYIPRMALKFSLKVRRKKNSQQNPGVIRGGALVARFVGSVLSAMPMKEF